MKRFLKILCLIVLLSAMDQGAKILVSQLFNYDPESLMQVKDTIHIHPMVNHSNAEWIIEMVQKTGIGVVFWKLFDQITRLLTSALIHFMVFYVHRASVIANLKKRVALVHTLYVLIGSITVCGILDRLFWHGTQDFLCISNSFIADSGNLKIRHLSADIKDCYLDLFVVLLFVYVILLAIDFSRNKEAYSVFKQAMRIFSKNKNGGSSV